MEKTCVVIERVKTSQATQTPAATQQPHKLSDKTDKPRTGLLVRTKCNEGVVAASPVVAATSPMQANLSTALASANEIDSNVHTVQSDLEVLLSESEFLFSDD